jgi:phosphoribosylanthranilate isomerase
VAVLVNVPLEEARRIAEHPAIDLVQFHGDEDEEYCAAFTRFGRPFIKALRLKSAGEIERADGFSTRDLLVDAHVPGAYGGTGAKVDLQKARELAERRPDLRVILAGGLTPENVGDAVRQVRPFAVDVASGVEGATGRKDPERMRAFVENARGA